MHEIDQRCRGRRVAEQTTRYFLDNGGTYSGRITPMAEVPPSASAALHILYLLHSYSEYAYDFTIAIQSVKFYCVHVRQKSNFFTCFGASKRNLCPFELRFTVISQVRGASYLPTKPEKASSTRKIRNYHGFKIGYFWSSFLCTIKPWNNHHQ